MEKPTLSLLYSREETRVNRTGPPCGGLLQEPADDAAHDRDDMRREMNDRAVISALWLAVKAADDAGYRDLAFEIAALRQKAVMLSRDGVAA